MVAMLASSCRLPANAQGVTGYGVNARDPFDQRERLTPTQAGVSDAVFDGISAKSGMPTLPPPADPLISAAPSRSYRVKLLRTV
jgi:hypothetical protein